MTAKYTPTFVDRYGLPALGIGALAFLPEEEIEEEEQMSIQDYIDASYPPDYFNMDLAQQTPKDLLKYRPRSLGLVPRAAILPFSHAGMVQSALA